MLKMRSCSFWVLLSLIIFSAFPVFAETVTLAGNWVWEDSWRFSTGVQSEFLTADWFRTEKAGIISDGYDVTACHKIWFSEVQYKQIHRSEKAIDTQELALMASVNGLGVGVASSWLGSFEARKTLAKVKYELDLFAFNVQVDWSSNFKDRRAWSASPRISIPARWNLSLIAKGKYGQTKTDGEIKEWASAEVGIALDLDKLRKE